MAQKQYVESLAAGEEDSLLLRRVQDMLRRFRNRNCPEHSRFLTPREQQLCSRLLRAEGERDFLFWGGYPDAERRLLALVPDWMEAETWLTGAESPAALLRCRFSGPPPEHRQLLGALMSTGLKRDAIGDLLISPGQADVSVLRELLPYLRTELTRAGRVHLQLEEVSFSQLVVPEQRREQRRETVASLRADCVLAAMLRLSRDKAAGLIRQGQVQVDALELSKGDRPLAPGQTISVRGYGKFRLLQADGLTKKGRIPLVFEKYI